MSKIRVAWVIGDGYIGKDRPMYTYFDSEEFGGMSKTDMHAYIEEGVWEDMQAQVTTDILNMEDAVQEIEAALRRDKEGNQ